MKDTYPLPGVKISESSSVPVVRDPVYKGPNWQAGESEYSLQVEGVGDFHALDGREVTFCPDPGADPDWVRLYLNGQVLVALLHQRRIISFHASSFIYKDRGVMVVGDTGSGKSSLTLSFALDSSVFLTDDLTPVISRKGRPLIWPLHRDIKLRADTIGQLDIDPVTMREAEAGTGKKYLSFKRSGYKDHSLDVIIKIEVGDCEKLEFHEAGASDRFSILRSEVCSWEMLAGMPETERSYLLQLLQIVEKVHFVRVIRPSEIKIKELHGLVSEYLSNSLDVMGRR